MRSYAIMVLESVSFYWRENPDIGQGKLKCPELTAAPIGMLPLETYWRDTL